MTLDLLEALERGLKERDKTRHEWDQSSIHVTDLAVALPIDDGGACPRSLWLRVHGAERKEQTLGKRLMFDNAHSIHERVAEFLRLGLPEEWVIEAIEESVSDKLPRKMKGRLDLKLRNTKTGVVLILDIKTVRGAAFKWLTKAKPSHIIQVQAYIMAAKADGGIIIYLDREGQNAALQFSVPRADARVIDAMARTHLVVDAPEPPPVLKPSVNRKEYKTMDSFYVNLPFQCGYCDMLDVSCKGALPPEQRDMGVVARIDKKKNAKSEIEWPLVRIGRGLNGEDNTAESPEEIRQLIRDHIANPTEEKDAEEVL